MGLPGYQNGIGSWSGPVVSGIGGKSRNSLFSLETSPLRRRLGDDPEVVDEALARSAEVAAVPRVLHRDRAAADAVVQAAVRQVVQDAEVLDDLHRMMHRQQLDHRAKTDVLGDLGRRRDEDVLVRRHREVRAVVLGEVEAPEPGLVGRADEVQPILEDLGGRVPGNALDVVEQPERWSLHVASLSQLSDDVRVCHVMG